MSRILAAFVFALALVGSSIEYLAPQASANVAVTDNQIATHGSFTDLEHNRIAPGLELSSFSRLESKGWNEGTILTANMSEPTLSMDVVDGGTAAGSAPVSELMTSGPRGGEAVAAINGTFFDIHHSDAPNTTSVSRDGLRGGIPEPRPAITVADGVAAVQQLAATGTVTINGESHELDGINNPHLKDNELGLYNQLWGDYPLDRTLGAPDKLPKDIARATVVDGVVVEASGLTESVNKPELPNGGQVLIGRDATAHELAKLKVGDKVEIEVSSAPNVDVGMAGSHQILVNGSVPKLPNDDFSAKEHPRTAVGVSADGSEMYMIVIDGRTSKSHGMSLQDLGELFADIGAHNAVNLDGGGSSTMVARTAGSESASVQNFPSDGAQRDVPDALVFYSEASSNDLADVQLKPAVASSSPTDAVFPGMQRTFKGRGLATNGDPLLSDGKFTANGPVDVETVSPTEARVTGLKTGKAGLTYQAGGHQDRADIRVLGELAGLTASDRSLNLIDTEDKKAVTLSGFDTDGHRAAIETADIEVEIKGDFTVADNGAETWLVSAGPEAKAGSITFKHGEVSTRVDLSVETDEQVVSDFADTSQFNDANPDRAKGKFSAAEGPVDADGKPQPAIGLEYDFKTLPATRGYYLNVNEPFKVDGQALAFEMDIRGDGSGVWPRLQIQAADGTTPNLDGDLITHEGWETVRFTVPQGLPQPLSVKAIRMMETDPESKYEGDIAVANLRAIVAPSVDAQTVSAVHDPAIIANGSVSDRAQKIAVMSDAQFVAAHPDSDAVAGARRTLREIKAAKPDLMIINGDFVDEATPEDFKLAQRILDEEWTADIPYVYVPGNHEAKGKTISNFLKANGPATTQQTLGRTEIMTLDSSRGSLRAGGLDQIANLETQLDAIANNDERTGVVVFFHHPPTDPTSTGASALSDQREARAIEKLLTDFRNTSGKSAAVVNAGVGIFHGSAVEGVTYLINGNSGKNPSENPENGGFTGWTMLGINPDAGLVGQEPEVASRVDWLAAETRPWVDDLEITAPATLPAGESAEVSATLTQDGAEVPVNWPVTAQWGGEGVVIDDGTQDDLSDQMGYEKNPTVRVNPSTGTITALRPGTATISVTVNGKTATTEVKVTGNPGKPTGKGSGSSASVNAGSSGSSAAIGLPRFGSSVSFGFPRFGSS